jgi:hypothetical protein
VLRLNLATLASLPGGLLARSAAAFDASRRTSARRSEQDSHNNDHAASTDASVLRSELSEHKDAYSEEYIAVIASVIAFTLGVDGQWCVQFELTGPVNSADTTRQPATHRFCSSSVVMLASASESSHAGTGRKLDPEGTIHTAILFTRAARLFPL